MRFQIMSDLHLEFRHMVDADKFIALTPVRASTLVLAGDICEGGSIPYFMLQFLAKWENVVYVPGNHEYYQNNRRRVRRALGTVSDPRFHWLDNSAVEIEGQRFIGATMWFPGTPDAIRLSRGFSDFAYIDELASWVYVENTETVEYLQQTILEGDVVVTHHLPSALSTPPAFYGNEYNCFWYCPMENVMRRKKPAIWVHGHTHDSTDHMVYDTRVVCNPHGYAGGNSNAIFDPTWVIDTEGDSDEEDQG